MSFSNSDFLQLSYSFEPIHCPGQQSMSFVVPPGVPNGEAYVTCADQYQHCYDHKLGKYTHNNSDKNTHNDFDKLLI
ncbi:hypothetical protein PG991_008941 [Apiospora marii]|uniref:Uncharacterized protein n=1 Tax=Apiospora marii TaxID=335849 RepID=A0ABR1RJK8_9PEZI